MPASRSAINGSSLDANFKRAYVDGCIRRAAEW
jgi:hypothetical protein